MTVPLPEVFTRIGRTFYYLLSNMRSCDRIPIAGSINASYYDDRGTKVNLHCECFDFSPLGIGVYSTVALQAGIAVSLSAGDLSPLRTAYIRYCNQCGGRFRIGMAFETYDLARSSGTGTLQHEHTC